MGRCTSMNRFSAETILVNERQDWDSVSSFLNTMMNTTTNKKKYQQSKTEQSIYRHKTHLDVVCLMIVELMITSDRVRDNDDGDRVGGYRVDQSSVVIHDIHNNQLRGRINEGEL